LATIGPILKQLEERARLRRSILSASSGLDGFVELRRRERQALGRLLGDGDDVKYRAASELTAIIWNRSLLSPKPADRAIYRAARRGAREHKTNLRNFVSDNLILGFLQASREAATKQFVRIGPSWKKNKYGRKQRIAPCTLPQGELLMWLRARAFRHLRDLIGRDGPEQGSRAPSLTALDEQLINSLEAGRLLDTRQSSSAAVSLLATAQQLSRRERRVMELTADGLNSREIGKKLRINPTTVRQYRRRARQKLNSL
jgi:RNA polymerase sigma factor (sigma-70 family)